MGETMKAVVYKGDGKTVFFEDRPLPEIKDPQDAIVKVELSTICASDLHIQDGTVPRAYDDIVLGHEFVGKVVEVGSDVKKLKVGDRVVSNCITFCGDCYFCREGFINNCEKGGWEIGCRVDGCQTEYTRVPFADMGLAVIPESVSYEDALFVGDVLASGYFGVELAEVKPGDTVAVIGAGPVGLCTLMCAQLFGAAEVIAIDVIDHRLKLAEKEGLAEYTINPKEEDVVERIMEITDGRGADAVIEAAGGKDTFQTAWKIARPNSVVSVVAMYPEAQVLPLEKMYGKNLIWKSGGVDAIHSDKLLKLIAAGKLDTSILITHRSPLNDIEEGYKVFANQLDNVIKWVVTPYER